MADSETGHDLLRPLRATLGAIGTVAAPTSLVTALLYYFGWERTSTQAAALGLQDTLLGFSAQDYLLRSIAPMFWPAFVAALVALFGLALHGALVTWAGAAPVVGHRRRLLAWGTAAIAALGLIALGLGVVGNNVERPSRLVSLASPLCITASLVLLGYALHLVGRFLASRRLVEPLPELRRIRLLTASLMVFLLLLSLFWSVSRYAQITGIDLARRVVDRELQFQPDVVVYSAKRLHLQPPVAETELGDENSAYRFAYSGLKLLFRSERKYFLRPADAAASLANIVIAESPELRFELHPVVIP